MAPKIKILSESITHILPSSKTMNVRYDISTERYTFDEILDNTLVPYEVPYDGELIRFVASTFYNIKVNEPSSTGRIFNLIEWNDITKKLVRKYKVGQINKLIPQFKINLLNVIFAYITFIMYTADYLSDSYVAYEHYAKGKTDLINI